MFSVCGKAYPSLASLHIHMYTYTHAYTHCYMLRYAFTRSKSLSRLNIPLTPSILSAFIDYLIITFISLSSHPQRSALLACNSTTGEITVRGEKWMSMKQEEFLFSFTYLTLSFSDVHKICPRKIVFNIKIIYVEQ